MRSCWITVAGASTVGSTLQGETDRDACEVFAFTDAARFYEVARMSELGVSAPRPPRGPFFLILLTPMRRGSMAAICPAPHLAGNQSFRTNIPAAASVDMLGAITSSRKTSLSSSGTLVHLEVHLFGNNIY